MLLASLVAAVLIVLAMAVLGEYTKTRGRMLLTALSLAGFCLLALPPAVLAMRGQYARVAAGSTLVLCLGFLLVVVGMWATPDSDAFWKAAAIISIAAASGSHFCWLLLLRVRRLLAQVARCTALGATGLVLILTGLAIIVEIRDASFWWAVVLLIIAQVAGGLAAPALDRWGFTLSGFHHPPADKLGSTGRDEM